MFEFAKTSKSLDEKFVSEQLALNSLWNMEQRRNLTDYCDYLDGQGEQKYQPSVLGYYEPSISSHLRLAISDNGSAVYVDLGCGHEVALRESKAYMEKANVDPKKLHTYGVDPQPFDVKMLKSVITPKSVANKLARDEYAPVRLSPNAETVVFPEKADVISIFNMLFYASDPLKVLTNAYKQLKVGGLIILNGCEHIYYCKYPKFKIYKRNLFTRVTEENRSLFSPLVSDSANHALIKVSSKPFKADYSVFSKARTKSRKEFGFDHIYVDSDKNA